MHSDSKVGFPLYFKGDQVFIAKVQLAFDTILNTPKPYPVSIPFLPQLSEKFEILEPILYLEIVDDRNREFFMKDRKKLQQDIFYVYFPTVFRVDEKIYKVYCKNFENLVDYAPSAMKRQFAKLVLWEQGKGENSIESQTYRLNDNLSNFAKMIIEKKIEVMTQEIKQHQKQITNSKSLLRVFVLKNKLAQIYSFLELPGVAIEYLKELWNQIMYNFRGLMQLPQKFENKLPKPLESACLDIPKPPFALTELNDVLGYFESRSCTAYLRIATHSFFRLFYYYLQTQYHNEAMITLKIFVDFIFKNILIHINREEESTQDTKMYDIAKNLWAIQVISIALQKQSQKIENVRKKRRVTLTTSYYQTHINVCSIFRNSVEKIGFLMYKFDNFSIFPDSIQTEFRLLRQKLEIIGRKKTMQEEGIQSQTQHDLMEIETEKESGVDISQIFSEQLPQNPVVIKVTTSFEGFSQVYLNSLKTIQISLKYSAYSRLHNSMKLTIQKASIMLSKEQIQHCPQTFSSHLTQTQNQTMIFINKWSHLGAIEQLYTFFIKFIKSIFSFSVKNSVKMEPQDEIYQNFVQTICNRILFQQYQSWLEFTARVSKELKIIDKFMKNRQGIKIGQILQATIINKQNNNYVVKIILLNANLLQFDMQRVQLSLVVNNIIYNRNQKQQLECIALDSSSMEIVDRNEDAVYVQLLFSEQINDNQPRVFQLRALNLVFYQQTDNGSKLEGELRVILSYCNIAANFNKSLYLNIPIISTVDDLPHVASSSLLKSLPVYQGLWTPIQLSISNIKSDQTSIKMIAIELLNPPAESLQLSFEISSKIHVQQSSQTSLINDQKYVISEQSINMKSGKQSSIYFTIFVLVNLKKQCKNIVDPINERYMQIKVKAKVHNPIYKAPIDIFTVLDSFEINKPLSADYFNVNTYEEWKVVSNSHCQLFVQSEKGGGYYLQKQQILHLSEKFLEISPSTYRAMKARINLCHYLSSNQQQQLLHQGHQYQTFELSYCSSYEYKVMQQIGIKSEEIGHIQINHRSCQDSQIHGEVAGYELIGKVKGNVQYSNKEQRILNLWVMPVMTGNIALPEIWINNKRGIWSEELIMGVKI